MSEVKDLTMEHIERVNKGKVKTSNQLRKIADAVGQLKLAEESPTYAISIDQWDEVFRFIRSEVDDLEVHVRRSKERQARGRPLHVEWRDGKLVKGA